MAEKPVVQVVIRVVQMGPQRFRAWSPVMAATWVEMGTSAAAVAQLGAMIRLLRPDETLEVIVQGVL